MIHDAFVCYLSDKKIIKAQIIKSFALDLTTSVGTMFSVSDATAIVSSAILDKNFFFIL